jgi:hypothetical protein
MGVARWPTWGCGVSKFPWSYAENETCYVLQGHVLVTPDGAHAAGQTCCNDLTDFTWFDGQSDRTRVNLVLLAIIRGHVSMADV